MQIIITNLSRLKPDAAECSYDSDIGEIHGTNTNDAPVIYLLRRFCSEEPARQDAGNHAGLFVYQKLSSQYVQPCQRGK